MKTRRKCGPNDPFHAVGMTRDNGKLKIRWNNDPGFCYTNFKSKGHTDILMLHLSEPLNKRDCVLYLKYRAPEFQGEEHMKVIDDYLVKHP